MYMREDVRQYFDGDPVERAWALSGEVVRSVARRETLRVELGGRFYYLKRHRGVGWLEVLKNWIVLKRPITGAANEFAACRHLEHARLTAPTVAAYAQTAGAPATRSSFVLCDALLGYEDLQTLTRRWLENPPDPFEKRRLVHLVADFARRFHAAGVVHRDFYLCHLLIHEDRAGDDLAVLDLHRALLFDTVPGRWQRRDLAALLFSALDLPLDRRSWLRFVRIYTGRPLQQVFTEEGPFWDRIYRRALSLYRKGSRKGLTFGNFQQ
jgi:heptose I phosphotransferase